MDDWGYLGRISEKARIRVEAIRTRQLRHGLILPGFGAKIRGSKHQKCYFKSPEYDLFIPKYISRKSVEASVGNLDHFCQKIVALAEEEDF